MSDRGTTREFRADGLVNCPIDKAYQLLASVERYPSWMPSVLASRTLTAGPLVSGSHVLYDLSILRFRVPVEAVVTEALADQLIAFESVRGLSLRGHWRVVAEALGTRIEFRLRFRFPGGALGWAARVVDVEGMLATKAREALENFRKLAEQ